MSKPLKVTIILCVILWALIRLRPIWERYPGGLWNNLFFLLIAILFLWILIKVFLELKRIVWTPKEQRTSVLYLPLLILSLTLLDIYFNPLHIDLDRIYGKVNFRACHEGTMNSATLKLRSSNKFDLHWIGAFGYDAFFVGTYKIIDDTLMLNYHGKKPVRFGSIALMDNENQLLTTIRSDNDGLMNVPPFYYGFCKGLN